MDDKVVVLPPIAVCWSSNSAGLPQCLTSPRPLAPEWREGRGWSSVSSAVAWHVSPLWGRRSPPPPQQQWGSPPSGPSLALACHTVSQVNRYNAKKAAQQEAQRRQQQQRELEATERHQMNLYKEQMRYADRRSFGLFPKIYAPTVCWGRGMWFRLQLCSPVMPPPNPAFFLSHFVPSLSKSKPSSQKQTWGQGDGRWVKNQIFGVDPSPTHPPLYPPGPRGAVDGPLSNSLSP